MADAVSGKTMAALVCAIVGDDQAARLHVAAIPEADLRRALTALTIAAGRMIAGAAGSDAGAAEVAAWGREYAVWFLEQPVGYLEHGEQVEGLGDLDG